MGNGSMKSNSLLSVLLTTLLFGQPSQGQISPIKQAACDRLWGSVIRCDSDNAEFNLGLADGLWSSDRVWVYREHGTQPVDVLTVKIVDERHGVGRYEKGNSPKVGDKILFARKRVIQDEVANHLIG